MKDRMEELLDEIERLRMDEAFITRALSLLKRHRPILERLTR